MKIHSEVIQIHSPMHDWNRKVSYLNVGLSADKWNMATSVVFKTLIILQIVLLVVHHPEAENFYQHRDHRDQNKYERYRQEAVTINNFQDVEVCMI